MIASNVEACCQKLSHARLKFVWILFLFALLAQIIWYRQSFKFLAGQIRVNSIYQIRNTSNDSVFVSSWSVRKFTLSGQEPDDRARDGGVSHQHELMFINLLQKSLNGTSDSSNLNIRMLGEAYIPVARRLCPRLLGLERSAIFSAMLNRFTLRDNDQRDTFVNLHRYGYLLDSNPCRESTDVIILVHSKYDHFDRRQQIRNTWASNRTSTGLGIRTVFFLGQPNVREVLARQLRARPSNRQQRLGAGDQVRAVMTKIRQEARTFSDLVMGNFTDSYRNLTVKHILALKWVTSRCPGVPHVVKVDDDVMIDTYSLARYIRQVRNMKGHLTCRVPQVGKVQRERRDKWFVSKKEYPYPLYPLWCLGYGILMSSDVAKKLLQTSRDVKSFWIDDVYVTGILRYKTGIQLRPLPLRISNMAHATSGKFGTIFLLRNFLGNNTLQSYWRLLQDVNRGQV